MRRVVIDTNLYIDWLNAGRHEGVLFERDAVKFLSAVVMLELYAGAFSPRDRRVVRGVVAAFDRADRILVPSGAVYEDAGHVLRGLQRLRGYQVATSSSLVNDVLIALSARSIGASVVTSNARDFAAIREVRPFKLSVVPT
jgi:predicted nucleic acid-binding protein